jgi:glycosyltransferase involved in cell wall biosynthesis
MKIIHIITGLGRGGAETALSRLIIHSHRADAAHQIVTLRTPDPSMATPLVEKGIVIKSLNMSKTTFFPAIYRLVRYLRQEATGPNTIIQTWLYHGDFCGSLAAKFARIKAPIIWNLRRTAFPKGLTGLIAKINKKMSHNIPSAIVSCSRAGAQHHIRHGYRSDRFQIIPNGYDITQFSPNPSQRVTLRERLLIPTEVRVIGIMGRYNPIKGHIQMLEAISRTNIPNLHFLFVGRDIAEAADLQPWLTHKAVANKISILPETNDIEHIMAGLDFLCMPSLSEGFPNVVAEAMSCGIPCIVTDVGDAADIVGDTGLVLPDANPATLIRGICQALGWSSNTWEAKSKKARQRIIDTYSINRMCLTYFDLYDDILNNMHHE